MKCEEKKRKEKKNNGDHQFDDIGHFVGLVK